MGAARYSPMSQSKRLLFYIAINVLVSACTTLTILFVWDRSHPSTAISLPGQATSSPAGSSTPSTSLTPVSRTSPAGTSVASAASSPIPDASGNVILVDNVFGAGDLANEVVLIKRTGEGELTLTGWQITGDDGSAFTFPSLVLYPGGAVQVHTAAGVNSVVDMYWGLDEPVWQSGETVTLLDAQGKIYSTYRIP